MSEKAEIIKLMEKHRCYKHIPATQTKIQAKLETVATEIERLYETRSKTKWTAIADKKPPEEGRYLVWAKGSTEPTICLFVINYDDTYYWYREGPFCEPDENPITEDSNDPCEVMPTHWASLPELPTR